MGFFLAPLLPSEATIWASCPASLPVVVVVVVVVVVASLQLQLQLQLQLAGLRHSKAQHQAHRGVASLGLLPCFQL